MEPQTMATMIERIRTQMSPLPMQPPCAEEEINAIPSLIRKKLRAEVPPRYLYLLRITNGISHNALRVFGSRPARNVASDMIGREFLVGGIVEENVFYRDQDDLFQDLLVFAAREEYLYAQLIETGLFVKLVDTDLEGRPRAVFKTFDDMMVAAMESILVS